MIGCSIKSDTNKRIGEKICLTSFLPKSELISFDIFFLQLTLSCSPSFSFFLLPIHLYAPFLLLSPSFSFFLLPFFFFFFPIHLYAPFLLLFLLLFFFSPLFLLPPIYLFSFYFYLFPFFFTSFLAFDPLCTLLLFF